MHHESRLPIENLLSQPAVNLFSVPAISNDSKLKGRLYGLNLAKALTDISDRTCVRGKRDEKSCSNQEQDLHRVRNEVPLRCGGV
jgi:hypothetical protein